MPTFEDDTFSPDDTAGLPVGDKRHVENLLRFKVVNAEIKSLKEAQLKYEATLNGIGAAIKRIEDTLNVGEFVRKAAVWILATVPTVVLAYFAWKGYK